MTVVVLWVGDSTDPNYNHKLLKMLSLFFRSEISIEQSHHILTTEYGFQRTFLTEEVKMKSWARDIENEGYERGVKQGLEQGVRLGMCNTVKRLMVSMNKTLEDAMALLQLSDDEKRSVRACFAS